MRRFFISIGILLVLLFCGIANANYAGALTEDISTQLNQAQALVHEQQWEQALAATQKIYTQWNSHHFYLHTILRHVETDQVTLGFETVLECLKLQDAQQYSTANAALLTHLSLLREMETISLANVL